MDDDDKVLNCLSGTKIFGYKNHTWRKNSLRKQEKDDDDDDDKKLIEVGTFSYARFMFAKNFFLLYFT